MILACLWCGQKNRIPVGVDPRQCRCRRCGIYLPEPSLLEIPMRDLASKVFHWIVARPSLAPKPTRPPRPVPLLSFLGKAQTSIAGILHQHFWQKTGLCVSALVVLSPPWQAPYHGFVGFHFLLAPPSHTTIDMNTLLLELALVWIVPGWMIWKQKQNEGQEEGP